MPAAVAVPLILGGVTAGTTIYGANKQANANKDAAKTAADASTRAAELDAQAQRESLDWAKQVYNTRQQQLAPYLALSQGGLGMLAGMSGLPAPKMPAPPTNQATGGMGIPAVPASGMPVTFGPLAGQGSVPTGTPFPTGAAANAPTGGAQSGGNGLTPMMGPDGKVQMVPSTQVTMYAARGLRPLAMGA